MNYTLQLHGERMLYPTPPGLYEMMSDIAREVLRDQPSQVYEYIAHYLDTLLRVREYARVGEETVSDVLEDNCEVLTYVNSLGLSWSEANQAASRIQRAFHIYKCRKQLKMKIKIKKQVIEMQSLDESRRVSESFQQFLNNLGVDLEQAERATIVIQNAYKMYKAKQETKERDTSSHTIEIIPLKSLSIIKKPAKSKRNSKLLVYQQTPKHSEESTWSTLRRDMDEAEARYEGQPVTLKPFTLVYEQDKSLSNYKYVPKPLKSEFSAVPADRFSLPSYYDENGQKIPMISESGLLLREETEEVVTLFSSDSVDDDMKRRSRRSSSFSRYPSLSNVAPGPKNEEMAKELFEIIGSKASPEQLVTEPSPLTKVSSIMKRGSSKHSAVENSAELKKSFVKYSTFKQSLSGSLGRPSFRQHDSKTDQTSVTDVRLVQEIEEEMTKVPSIEIP